MRDNSMKVVIEVIGRPGGTGNSLPVREAQEEQMAAMRNSLARYSSEVNPLAMANLTSFGMSLIPSLRMSRPRVAKNQVL